MFNITSKFSKVWKVEVKEKVVLLDLGESKKNQDGTYDNWTHFRCACLGGCLDKARTLGEGDTIEITSGGFGKQKSEKDGKWYDNILIFDFEVVSKGSNAQQAPSGGTYQPILNDDLSDDLPF